MATAPDEFLSLDDFERHALEVLPAMPRDYYRSGAWAETTLRENRAAWDRLRLWYRVMRDVSARTCRAEVVGREAAMPACVAPTALQCMAHPDGELATSRAAARAGVPMILSSLSSTSIEDVRAAATAVDPAARTWMQIYIGRDRGAVRALAQRAQAAGCDALVLTVDTPVWASGSVTSETTSACRTGCASCTWSAPAAPRATRAAASTRRSPGRSIRASPGMTSRGCAARRPSRCS